MSDYRYDVTIDADNIDAAAEELTLFRQSLLKASSV
jgi:hypothetical protein